MITKCSYCQKDIERKSHRAKYNKTGLWYCDKKCRGAYQTSLRTMSTCPICEKEFYAKPYRFDRSEQLACSRKCKAILLGGGGQIVNCEQCQKSFYRKNAELKTHNFCCRECMGAWQSQNMIGENSNSWRGGWPEYYGPSWSSRRRQAYERDNGTCQCCNATADQFGRALDVHHIKPFRLFSDHNDANDLSNLVTLCPICHPTADVIARRLFDEFWSNSDLLESFQNYSAILGIYLDHSATPT